MKNNPIKPIGFTPHVPTDTEQAFRLALHHQLSGKLAEFPIFDHVKPTIITVKKPEHATKYTIGMYLPETPKPYTYPKTADSPLAARALNPIVPDFFIFPTHYQINRYNPETHQPETLGTFPLKQKPHDTAPLIDRIIRNTLHRIYTPI